MPLPSFIISANVLVCERVLYEADGVLSAIRMIDVFYVSPEKPKGVPDQALPLLQASICAMLKSVPGHEEEHTFEIQLINTLGKASVLAGPIKSKLGASVGMESLPGGLGMNTNLNLSAQHTGTCYVLLLVDGQEVARTPISIVPKQGTMTAFAVPISESNE